MHGQWIIDLASDLRLPECSHHPVPVRNADHVLVEDAYAIRIDPRCYDISIREVAIIDRGILSTRIGPSVKIGEFDEKDGGLDGIKSEVPADEFVVVLRFRAVNAQRHEAVAKTWVVCDDHSTVTCATKVLAGEEAETAQVSNASRLTSF